MEYFLTRLYLVVLTAASLLLLGSHMLGTGDWPLVIGVLVVSWAHIRIDTSISRSLGAKYLSFEARRVVKELAGDIELYAPAAARALVLAAKDGVDPHLVERHPLPKLFDSISRDLRSRILCLPRKTIITIVWVITKAEAGK